MQENDSWFIVRWESISVLEVGSIAAVHVKSAMVLEGGEAAHETAKQGGNGGIEALQLQNY